MLNTGLPQTAFVERFRPAGRQSRFQVKHRHVTGTTGTNAHQLAESILARLVARSLLILDAITVTDLTKTDTQSIITKLTFALDRKQLDQKED